MGEDELQAVIDIDATIKNSRKQLTGDKKQSANKNADKRAEADLSVASSHAQQERDRSLAGSRTMGETQVQHNNRTN